MTILKGFLGVPFGFLLELIFIFLACGVLLQAVFTAPVYEAGVESVTAPYWSISATALFDGPSSTDVNFVPAAGFVAGQSATVVPVLNWTDPGLGAQLS